MESSVNALLDFKLINGVFHELIYFFLLIPKCYASSLFPDCFQRSRVSLSSSEGFPFLHLDRRALEMRVPIPDPPLSSPAALGKSRVLGTFVFSSQKLEINSTFLTGL